MRARAERERAFHNSSHAEHIRSGLAKYYSVAIESSEAYMRSVRTLGDGIRVLELGCGTGDDAIAVSKDGVTVTGVDISEAAISTARTKARAHGVAPIFRVMNAEELDFADSSFGIVCGRSVLHHLDLDRAISEVARTIEPGGRAVFLEPLGHNPVVNLYRRLTPHMRSVDERPLRLREIDKAHRYFGSVELRFFHLSAILAVPLRRAPGFKIVLKALELTDRLLLMTPLRRFAWIVVVTLAQPRKR